MALKFSDGFTAALAGGQGYYDIMRDCIFQIYTGTQPSTANLAPTGTLLATITNASGTYVPEVRAYITIDPSSMTTGKVITSLLIGGIEVLGSTFTKTASHATDATTLAGILNGFRSQPDFNAVVSGNTILLYAPKNAGASLNGLSIKVYADENSTLKINNEAADTATTGDTLTTTFGAVVTSYGVAGVAASYGLTFTYPTDTKILSKTGTWTGVASAAGSAGWGRFVCRNRKTGGADSYADDALLVDVRMDVAVGTSAATAEAVVASTIVAAGATQTINSFSLTIGG